MPVRKIRHSTGIRAGWFAVVAVLAASGCAEVEPGDTSVPETPEHHAVVETPGRHAVALQPHRHARPETPQLCTAAQRPVEQGTASWYGKVHHGRRTASGAPFDMNGMTAAHRTLPFGAKIRVTHDGNGRSVVLTVTDRGPSVAGRILDVSRRAAQELDFRQDGVATVRLEVIGPC